MRACGSRSSASTAVSQQAWVGPDELVGALGDGDRPLGVVRERQARHAEHRGLLLDPARVGEHEAGVALQRHEVEVADGLDRREPPWRARARDRARVRGWTGKTIGSRRATRRARPPAAARRWGSSTFDGRWSVSNGVARAVEAQRSRQRRARRTSPSVRQQRVDHHVADQLDPVGRRALGEQVVDRVGGRGEEQIGERVGHEPVDLLGHRPVTAAQPRLDVGDRHAELGRTSGAGDRRVDVARPRPPRRRRSFADDRSRTPAMTRPSAPRAGRADLEVDVGRRDASSSKKTSHICAS